jgi:hypothetical protein
MAQLQLKMKSPQEHAAAATAVVQAALAELDGAVSCVGEAAGVAQAKSSSVRGGENEQRQQKVGREDAAVAAAAVEGVARRVAGVRREVQEVERGLEEGLKQMQQQQGRWGKVLPALIDASAALTAAQQHLEQRQQEEAAGRAGGAVEENQLREGLLDSERSGSGLDEDKEERDQQTGSTGRTDGSVWDEDGAEEEHPREQQVPLVPPGLVSGLLHVEQQLSRSLEELVKEPQGWLAGTQGEAMKRFTFKSWQ